jgi:tetratricopeptide (TPR) repeat protein
MTGEPPPTSERQRLRELMGRATLARVRGSHAEALRLAQEALVLEEANAETHEFIGDVLMALNRGADALHSFQRARELNPRRVELEDKVARAAVRSAARLEAMAHAQAVLEGRAPMGPQRKPSYAALFSLVLPGLGQIYNGELLKGAAVMLGFVVLLAVSSIGLVNKARAADLGGPYYHPPQSIFAVLGTSMVWVGLLVALWVFAVAEASLRASKKGTPDETGVV